MPIIKYNNILLKTGTSLLKFEGIAPPVDYPYGYWVHKDTAVITPLTQGFPYYGVNEDSKIEFDGLSAEGMIPVAINISKLVLMEGCQVVVNILGTQYWANLQIIDFPSTIENIGLGGAMFDSLTNIQRVIIRSFTPPPFTTGNIQSPNIKIYVPDLAVSVYKSTAPYSAFANLVYPLSDIE